jgi:hypothetical protein
MKSKYPLILAIMAVALWVGPAFPAFPPFPTFTLLAGQSHMETAPGVATALLSLDHEGNLTIIVDNISTADVSVPSQVLTAVFFNSPSHPVLTPESALLNGSTVLFASQPAGGNVGGEWAYASGLNLYNANQGISSAGFDLFGAANFNGPDLDGDAASVNGLGYGITSAGDDPDIGNAQVTGNVPLIHHVVVFTLSGAGDSIVIEDQNFTFQYGTALTDPHITVPLPPSVLLMGSGLMGLGLVGWRRRLHKT